MRSVTRAEVLEAADWCAQYGASLMAVSYAHASGEPLAVRAFVDAVVMHGMPPLADAAIRPGEMVHHEASSLLYAAALEGGPLPEGWKIVDDRACQSPVLSVLAPRATS